MNETLKLKTKEQEGLVEKDNQERRSFGTDFRAEKEGIWRQR